MRDSSLKFLCCLVVGLQLLTSVALAQRLVLCVHADGASSVEDQSEQQLCASERLVEPSCDEVAADVATDEKSCSDTPLGSPHVSAAQASRLAALGQAALPVFAVLPAFMQAPVDSFGPTCVERYVEDVGPAPDATLRSLSNVVLII